MEPVLTPEEMARADEASISAGTRAYDLMDRAAFACATVALRMLGRAYGSTVLVVAGKGNNGGDGIAAAGHLARAGVRARVLLLAEPTGEVARHLAWATALAPRGALHVTPWSTRAFDESAARADLLVDAVFGTGFSESPRGVAEQAIGRIASCARPVLAVDIPSGVSGADGSVSGVAVRADVTLAVQSLKVGHVTGPGSLRCGRIDVADIGIPIDGAHVFLPQREDVAAVLPRRRRDTHKYATGVLAVLAGSAGMTGAAILCASAAVRTGSGMVFLGVPRSSLEVLEETVTEAVKVGLPERDGQLDASSADAFAEWVSRAGALAVGPGIGRGARASSLVRRALDAPIPVIVDADGLTALAEVLRDDPDVIRRRNAPTVLTPHAGEYARLAGRPAAPPWEERLARATKAAERWGATVHLKGRRAVTASPEGVAWINATGNPGMATGGTGDVLTGVIGTLLAQGVKAPEATWAGAFVHGLAGDIAASRWGERSMTARDVCDAMAPALDRVAHPAGPDPRRGSHRFIRTVL